MNCRQTIRTSIRKKRQQLPASIQFASSLEVSLYIANTPWFQRSHRIAFYQATHGEPDITHLIYHAWERRKQCYLPVCHPLSQQILLFASYQPNQSLQLNRYGILEPCPVFSKTRTLCKPFTLDLVFVPLVAFDKKGNRLGSGKGYYDRTFAYLRRFPNPCKPLLVGVAYDFQEVEQLYAQDWDVAIDKIIVINTQGCPLLNHHSFDG